MVSSQNTHGMVKQMVSNHPHTQALTWQLTHQNETMCFIKRVGSTLSKSNNACPVKQSIANRMDTKAHTWQPASINPKITRRRSYNLRSSSPAISGGVQPQNFQNSTNYTSFEPHFNQDSKYTNDFI